MPNLGNAWHIPANPEPRGRGGMREPIGSVVAGAAVTILSGNQYQGAGNAGNQLQDGSAVLFKRETDANWTTVPILFEAAIGNNKYYTASLPADAFAVGVTVQYYLRIPYSDHDTTFVHARGVRRSVHAARAYSLMRPPRRSRRWSWPIGLGSTRWRRGAGAGGFSSSARCGLWVL